MKKILLSAFAIVAMTGCTKTQPVNEELPDKRIVATTNVIASKAIAADGVEFGLQYVRDDETTQDWAGTVTAATHKTDNGVAFNENYKKDNSNSYFKFFSDGGNAGVNADKTKITWTVNGTKDIVYNKAVWDAGNYNTPVTNGLAFDHMLTRIEVILQGKGGEDIDAIRGSWGNITAIKIAGLPGTITYDYAAATNAITYGPVLDKTDALPLLAGTTYKDPFASIAIGENPNTTVAGGIMVPSGGAISLFRLLISSSSTPQVVDKEIFISLINDIEAGTINKITLTFSAINKDVSVSSTVVSWKDGQTGTVEVPE